MGQRGLKHPIIQAAGVLDAAEARLLAGAGVTHIGFPLRLAHHREDLSEAAAAAVVATLPGLVTPLLITYLDKAAAIIDLCQSLAVDMVQLHGPAPAATLARLKSLAPQLTVVKSLIVQGDNLAELEETIRQTAAWVDGYITDTFDPATGACGATGKVHDWEISRRLVELSPRPVILAGGLTPENVEEAIRRVRPAGVDAHTGLEGRDGRKDPVRVAAFVERARAGFAGG
ncbi:MAG: phosphoribosylanthranilate isomerase [Pseudomonadota bacterium]|nr:phosphoribosylanthranilate isomerase [Pseudomonadota bacterium]